MERVLVESSGGKALFLGLGNVHLIILMHDSANVGMVLVNAKRASPKIHELTQDIDLFRQSRYLAGGVILMNYPFRGCLTYCLGRAIELFF